MSLDAVDEQQAAAAQAGDVPATQGDRAAEFARRRESLRQRHRFVLIGTVIVLLAAFALEVVDGERIAVRGFPQYPFPHSCVARAVIPSGCPACGLTRSFVYLAAGRWQDSLAMHRMGWVIALAFALQIPYRSVALLGANPRPLGARVPAVIGYSLVVLLFANWLFGLMFLP